MIDARKEFMAEALRLAEENIASGRGGPFGAVVVKNGEIIARGSNHVTSDNDPTAHAEVVAIREACAALGSFQLDGCEIYCSCEPCPMCLGAIYWARPERIYFAAGRRDAADAGFDDDFIDREISLIPGQRSIPGGQLLREEALHVFRQWKESDRKIPY
ncbi:nucleoside deaminase [Lentimicrobium sp.]|uniref:nucleoside deaminase n=1 Tax=Lentimicrobium sp. TaxID=2034841 RepID=UPI00345E8034